MGRQVTLWCVNTANTPSSSSLYLTRISRGVTTAIVCISSTTRLATRRLQTNYVRKRSRAKIRSRSAVTSLPLSLMTRRTSMKTSRTSPTPPSTTVSPPPRRYTNTWTSTWWDKITPRRCWLLPCTTTISDSGKSMITYSIRLDP